MSQSNAKTGLDLMVLIVAIVVAGAIVFSCM